MALDIHEVRGSELSKLRHGGGFSALDLDSRLTTLVAFNEGAAVGHVQIDWSGSNHDHVKEVLGRVPELRRVFVAPDARGMKIGTELIVSAAVVVRSKGHEALGLAVGLESEAALNLYYKLGFSEAPVDRFVSTHGWDQVKNEPMAHEVMYLTKSTGVELGVSLVR